MPGWFVGAVNTGSVTYPSSILAVCDIGSEKENRIDAVLASVLMIDAFIVSSKVNIHRTTGLSYFYKCRVFFGNNMIVVTCLF